MAKAMTLDRFLRQYHKQKLLKSAAVRRELRGMKDTFTKEGLIFHCQTPLDYFKMQIMHTSLSNKRRLEFGYDSVRNKLIEIWPSIDYQQRNHLMNLELYSLKESLPKFESQTGVMIMIPFFNELLNSLYHKEMVVFELPQFYRLYKQFAKECVDPAIYGFHPYESGFISQRFVCQNQHRFVLFDHTVNTFFVCDLNSYAEFVLFENAGLSDDVIAALGNCLLQQDVQEFLSICITSALLSARAAKKLNRLKIPPVFTKPWD